VGVWVFVCVSIYLEGEIERQTDAIDVQQTT